MRSSIEFPYRAPRRRARVTLSHLASGLLLAVLLVFAQQQASLHMLGHAVEQVTPKQPGAPHAGFCDQCIAFAGVDNPAPPADAAMRQERAVVERPQPFRYLAADVPFSAAYSSRAPPLAS